jgi:tRNA threonylcarbamoyladenosine biosynthesis protein TsaB
VRVLAIESATARGGVAVVGPDGLAAEVSAHVPGGHLEWLVPAIARVLDRAGLAPAAIEGLAVSIGPGGFTSLRVGVATAAAWAHVRGVPLIAVPTLEVLAAGVEGPGLVLAAIDARRGEVAAALFEGGPTSERRSDDLMGPPEAVRDLLGAVDGPVVVAGDALFRHAAALLGVLGPQAAAAPEAAWWPRASQCGALGRARLLRGERTEPLGLVPRYAHRPVARAFQAQEAAGRNGS